MATSIVLDDEGERKSHLAQPELLGRLENRVIARDPVIAVIGYASPRLEWALASYLIP